MLRNGTSNGRHRARRGIVAVVALSALTVGALLATVSPAAAARGIKCGDVITASTTLQANVGPCSGHGLIVRGSNITLNLNGRTVSGKNGAAETVGVLLDGVTGSTVRNGTVTGFDAGVVVMGGSGNTVSAITARDNVNDNIASSTEAHACTYGDGIVVEGSDGNTVVNNRALRNGPFSGISLIADSDGNAIRSNTVADNNLPNFDSSGNTGHCGAPFSRPWQDVGIRVEGPGAEDNTVSLNRVTNSGIGGITIHGYVYDPPPAGPEDNFPRDNPNTGNVITNNYVADTGRDTHTADALADGISVLRQGPAGVVGVSQGNTISNNTVVTSYRHGIFVGNPTQPGPHAGNVVTGNTVQYSLMDGIFLTNGAVNNTLTDNTAQYNGEHDGHDSNVNCDNNLWSNNVFDWVNQACVSPSAGVR